MPGDRALVAVWSRHGATADIGRVVAATLTGAGLDVDLLVNGGAPPAGAYRDVVLGSAVYGTRWCPGATRFARLHCDALATGRLWAFSSGMRRAAPGAPPVGLAAAGLARVDGHASFGGRLDRSLLPRQERVLMDLVHARDADERDWDAIRAWAGRIALSPEEPPAIPLDEPPVETFR